mgnify:CR=1 FL=1
MNINKYTEKAQEAILAAQQLADPAECPAACSELESQTQAGAWRRFVWGWALVSVFVSVSALRQRLPQQ